MRSGDLNDTEAFYLDETSSTPLPKPVILNLFLEEELDVVAYNAAISICAGGSLWQEAIALWLAVASEFNRRKAWVVGFLGEFGLGV